MCEDDRRTDGQLGELENSEVMDWCGTQLELGLLLDEDVRGGGGVVRSDVQRPQNSRFHKGLHKTHFSVHNGRLKLKRLKLNVISRKSNNFNYLKTVRNLKLGHRFNSQRGKSYKYIHEGS